jgi:phosphoribosylanthranilate isomerase
MALLTSVLVRGINNLSDARYCAGMGADGLIFTLDPALPGAVDAATVKELAGWVSGVEIIGEFGSTMPASEINRLIEECNLTRVVLRDFAGWPAVPALAVPALLDVSPLVAFDAEESAHAVPSTAFPAGYALLTTAEGAGTTTAPLWLRGEFTPDTLPSLLATIQPAGLVLEGGNEIKPGLRDFSEMEAVFEALEE